MSRKHSLASKDRWKNVPKEERTRRMRIIAQKRMRSLTEDQRRRIGRRLTRARLAKQKDAV